LYNRHQALVEEFSFRGYRHLSPLNKKLASGASTQDVFLNTIEEQKNILKEKNCDCFLEE